MSSKDAPHKMWGGRFRDALDPDLLSFTSSFGADRRLLRWDVVASIAHVQMLAATGIIPDPDATAIAGGLRALLADVASGGLKVEGPYEDIHSFMEAVLYQRLGPVAGRLHTARSRNDQVATAFRLFVKDQLVDLVARIIDLMKVTVARAEATVDVLLPGFTHLQHAQPVRLAHHLLAYVWMLDRDADRVVESHRRADVLPLGSGALAGVSFPIDRQRVAGALGFARLSDNSVDATGDRDFAVDAVAAAAQLMVHLSRWSEELVLWASDEFAFIALADRVATALVTCHRLGLRARYFGKVGGDDAGRFQLVSLKREGMDLRSVRVVRGATTQYGYIIVDQATGERTVFWDRDARLTVQPSDISPKDIMGAKALHIDGCDVEAALQAARWAREAGATVVADLDTVYKDVEKLFPFIDYLIASANFLTAVTGQD